ncbi:MAG: anaerobic ribonucleoside-triphosphate reductase activating protein [Firmicutes bacterium]|nr:anaerobic ribonucleoside-triphosphate reductase activating protein [Alicyclobacillaceae bacterium]MCL6497727.1 anaerobic ribonucleoside-triphosphate reductase activating protein [Bacillota bacterium]
MVGVAGWVPLSLVDAPGHPCATIFVAGCNLRCPYCFNPELVRPGDVDQVAAGAQIERVLERLLRLQGVIKDVAISGGEPTLWRGLGRLVGILRDMGFRVTLHTNGTYPDRLETLMRTGSVAYVAMDIKTAFSAYARVGGRADTGAQVLASTHVVRRWAPDYEFRTTLVPGIVGWEELWDLACTLRGSRRYVLQPFRSDLPLLDPAFQGLRPYPPELLAKWAKALAPYYQSVAVRRGGT